MHQNNRNGGINKAIRRDNTARVKLDPNARQFQGRDGMDGKGINKYSSDPSAGSTSNPTTKATSNVNPLAMKKDGNTERVHLPIQSVSSNMMRPHENKQQNANHMPNNQQVKRTHGDPQYRGGSNLISSPKNKDMFSTQPLPGRVEFPNPNTDPHKLSFYKRDDGLQSPR